VSKLGELFKEYFDEPIKWLDIDCLDEKKEDKIKDDKILVQFEAGKKSKEPEKPKEILVDKQEKMDKKEDNSEKTEEHTKSKTGEKSTEKIEDEELEEKSKEKAKKDKNEKGKE